MSIPLRMLILEDRPSDAELMLHELKKVGYDPIFRRVETREDFLAHLDPSLEVILADYSMPQFDALLALGKHLQHRSVEQQIQQNRQQGEVDKLRNE